jgi:hypothetical protein
VLAGAEENLFMGDRLIISDNREDPGNPLVLDGEAIDAAATSTGGWVRVLATTEQLRRERPDMERAARGGLALHRDHSTQFSILRSE